MWKNAVCYFTGDCEAVICGGVNVLMDPAMFIALSKARMLSPTGQCQTYSADADGYARSEGCGIVILKRLKDVGLFFTLLSHWFPSLALCSSRLRKGELVYCFCLVCL